jgi:hypothetical protein
VNKEKVLIGLTGNCLKVTVVIQQPLDWVAHVRQEFLSNLNNIKAESVRIVFSRISLKFNFINHLAVPRFAYFNPMYDDDGDKNLWKMVEQ